VSRTLIALALVGGCACTPGPDVVVVGTRELGEVAAAEGVSSRTGGHSLFAFGRSIWLFGDTQLTTPDSQGVRERANSWSFTSDLGAEDGLDSFETRTDAWGGPAELLIPTADELAFNQAQPPDGERLLVAPMTAVRDDTNGRVVVFYAKSRRSALGSITPLGSGVAIWTALDDDPIRPVLDAGSDEPTLLFHAPEPGFGQAALILNERLYAYACSEALYQPCVVARVELGQLFERAAWRFWTGREWSPNLADAVAVLEAATVLSVHFNFHVNRYLALYSEATSGAIELRFAPTPEGPWSPPTRVLDGDSARADGLIHPELRRAAGQLEYFSYRRDGSLHLVELELAAGE